jgi:hypothetical protein
LKKHVLNELLPHLSKATDARLFIISYLILLSSK